MNTEWKPIASAPKDGSLILLGCPDEGPDGRPALCLPGHWMKGWSDAPDEMGQDDGWVDVQHTDFYPGRSFGNPDYMHKGSQPTHWMPLPPAPTSHPIPTGATGEVQDESGMSPYCPECDGCGRISVLSDNSPDAHDVDIDCTHCGGSGSAADAAKNLARALQSERMQHLQIYGEYKNFHRSLCARFGYGHDPVHFRRDLVSLEEAIAAKVSAPAAGDAQMLEFVREVAQQKPEKPDHWSSCGQCERNISTAEDLLEAHAAIAQQKGEA